MQKWLKNRKKLQRILILWKQFQLRKRKKYKSSIWKETSTSENLPHNNKHKFTEIGKMESINDIIWIILGQKN